MMQNLRPSRFNAGSLLLNLRANHSLPLTRGLATAAKLHEAVIVSGARTPIGSFQSTLSELTGPKLGSIAISAALEKAGLKPDQATEVLMGNVVSAGLGQAPARQASLGAKIPENVPCTTINKVCSSGMKAITFAAQSVILGHQECVVAGGFESMSNVPYYVPKARKGYRYGHGQLLDGLVHDGLWDVYSDQHMGSCAEHCAAKHDISRDEQDRYAVRSYKLAAEATEKGWFKDEIVAVPVPQRKGDPILVSQDEEFKKVQYDKLPTLKPAFKKDGSVTAANSSSLNDGASATIVMSASKAAEWGLKPIARIRGFADAEAAPIDFPTAPALAIPKALKHAGVSVGDIDFWEINEAFSVVVLANLKLLGIPEDKVNVHGGAIALGHPIGSSGSRIVISLANILRQRGGKLGCAAICNGGGGASAIVIERL